MHSDSNQLLLNCCFGNPGIPGLYFDEDSKRYYNMRYVDFQRGNPYVFRIDDKGLLNSRKEIFARKFDYVIDKDIIFNLRDRITN